MTKEEAVAKGAEDGMATIAYTTNFDGWGNAEPTEDDVDTFTALVVERVGALYPRHEVSAEVSRSALESSVLTDDDAIDRAELVSYIGNEVWDAWCRGERAAAVVDEDEVQP
jgi:hypothetical protein